ncbi:glycosyltransferase family 2 protein [Campylobacter lanienae]|uniref:glycosyltransferase family 2 protein n=1 Tax=Campylobacter lanienae TaxID=75658 RepID=UPI0015D837C2|nr:glycosyltransferase family 2 protein [Campylobacter lanienae]
MQDKKVGIVIPIYNVEKYLKECLDSVINQTYKNLEIILVNDGSTDNSLDIAKDYAKNDPRITIINKQNGGQSSARNAGIEYFSGEYSLEYCKNIDGLEEYNIKCNNPLNIYNILNQNKINVVSQIDYLIFLDSDDYWELECLEECVLRMDGVDIVWFDWQYFGNVTEQIKRYGTRIKNKYEYHEEMKISNVEFLERSYSIRNKHKIFAYVVSGLIDWNYLLSLKLKFIQNIKHEDTHFGSILFAYARNIYVYPKSLYYYRIHSDSTSSYLHKKSISPFVKEWFGFNSSDDISDEFIYDYWSKLSLLINANEIIQFYKQHDENYSFERLLRDIVIPDFFKRSVDILKLTDNNGGGYDPCNAIDYLINLINFCEKAINKLNIKL